jgi:hypothetical protein
MFIIVYIRRGYIEVLDISYPPEYADLFILEIRWNIEVTRHFNLFNFHLKVCLLRETLKYSYILLNS